MGLFLLILSKSLPKKRIIKPSGVTAIKNTAPITIGNTIEPKRIPNLNHDLFNGVKNLKFSKSVNLNYFSNPLIFSNIVFAIN